ncbi:hypothetical protein KAR91_40890 [Candidatus Pacearchaeota archaeon]|nr:hypothetical protein [Candidatus Pacearchaeota archaeon]
MKLNIIVDKNQTIKFLQMYLSVFEKDTIRKGSFEAFLNSHFVMYRRDEDNLFGSYFESSYGSYKEQAIEIYNNWYEKRGES